MKRITIPLFLAFLFILFAVTACDDMLEPEVDPPEVDSTGSEETTEGETLPPGAQPLSFSYEIDAPEGFAPGKPITVTVSMTNTASIPLSYVGSSSYQMPYYYIYYLDEEGYEHRLELNPYGETADQNPYTIQPGEPLWRTYNEVIPEDAPAGAYHMVVHCVWNPEWNETFENVFTIPDAP